MTLLLPLFNGGNLIVIPARLRSLVPDTNDTTAAIIARQLTVAPVTPQPDEE